jgi:peptidyl-prolyl cis-trans isomerase B (cyclophilin B)
MNRKRTRTKENAVADLKAVIETDKGVINLTLFADQAPLTVANFVNLTNRGYYDGLVFHRVIDDFMVQGGCPQGTGTGGPGYNFADECTPDLRHGDPGVLSMANAGPGTNGSQFFITHVPTPWLDGKHTVFGKVVGAADQDVVNAIAGRDGLKKITIEGDSGPLLEKMADQVAKWNERLGG